MADFKEMKRKESNQISIRKTEKIFCFEQTNE